MLIVRQISGVGKIINKKRGASNLINKVEEIWACLEERATLQRAGRRKKMLNKVVKIGALAILSAVVSGCATERSQALVVPAVAAAMLSR